MAQKRTSTAKKKQTPKSTASSTKVTRITAKDAPHKLTPTEKAAKRSTKDLHKSANAPSKRETTEQTAEKQAKRLGNPFASIWAYFRGAWYELRQVRWPDRANTWQMTGALIAFCVFFIVLILLLDAGFKYLFELLIG